MVLAAGLGTRLRPFTDTLPKPLLPVANRPILEYTFALLAGSGVSEVIVNTHHLADTLEEGLRRIDTSGLKVALSRERKILGTAGGPKRAAPFLEGGAFLLLNGDFLVDIDLREVVAFHREKGAKATMALREDPSGGIYLDGGGRIRQFLDPGSAPDPGWTRCGFTGIHVLEPEVLKLIPRNTPYEINKEVYPAMFGKGWPVCGFLHAGYWREAGDPGGFLAANIEVAAGRAGGIALRPGSGATELQGEGLTSPLLVGAGALIEGGAIIGPEVVVGPEARIGRGARVRRSVILEGGDVPDGTKIEGVILSPEGKVQVGS
jgi:NDP-sugar pyrophosphorylase family protein